ncbi:MAG: TIGR02444 family protein [Pseudomonas sp.]
MPRDFWDFACHLYRRDGVEHACLQLQDNAGVDVSAVLLCCWLGQAYGEHAGRHLETLLADAATWSRQLVAPLRRARYWYRSRPDAMRDAALYQQLKDVELMAEKALMQQLDSRARQLLGTSRHTAAAPRAAAKDFVHSYLKGATIVLDDSAQQQLALILAALDGDS